MWRALIILTGFLLNAGPVFTQEKTQVYINCADGSRMTLEGIGNTRIVLKDGSIKKNCVIQEIGKIGIVYLKDKVLHDMMIDRIKRIELKDGYNAIYFDEKNIPLIKGMD